jgi:hypothetical protein
LEVENADGTVRFLPLASVKQYYETPGVEHVHKWQLDNKPVDEITEESCACGAERQVIRETDQDGTTTTIRIFEPSCPEDTDPEANP